MNGVRTYYLYADEGLIAEYDSTGTEIRSYGYLPGTANSVAPLYTKENSQYYWYHNDHIGTPQQLVDDTGAVAWEARYTSFGKADPVTEIITNNFRLPGHYYDEETGLHYNGHRYYDPDTGRYLRTDPLGIDGGLNLYVYAMNSPLMFTDPDGLIARATWDNRHDVLAGAGLIPGLGIIPDALDTVLYAAEGDMGNAALSGLAMVPILGQGSRGAQYAAKYGDEALDGAKYVYKNADEAIAAGKATPQLTTTVITDTNRMLLAPQSKTFRDAKSRLRNSDGTFAYDGGSKRPNSNGVHGNTAGNQPAILYERYDSNGEFLKHGISQNPSKRYTQAELDGGYLIETQTGPRKDILKIERDLVETNPGPLNKEPWAGSKRK